MNRDEIHSRIDLLIEKLSGKNKELAKNNEAFSQLETDLLRSNCIELYDAIHALSLANSQPIAIEAEEKQDIKMETAPKAVEVPVRLEEPAKEIEPVNEITAPETAEMPEPLEDHAEEIESFNEIINEKAIPEIPEEIIEVIPPPVKVIKDEEPRSYDMPKFVPVAEKPAPTKPPEVKKELEDKNVLDKISPNHQRQTLHDTISAEKEEKPHVGFSGYKISKITEAIDISKRFELQNNLFGGNSQIYVQAINEIDEAKSKFSALEVFNQLAEKFHWDLKGELVQELKNFINRKFSA